MLIKEFPDIHWLKTAIAQNFELRESWDKKPLPNTGWPTAILNVTTKQVERKDIKGPFSLFLNKSGKSVVTCDQKTIVLSDETYVTSNSGQHYDLLIHERENTETFNIHFGDQLYQDVVHSLSNPHEGLLDRTTLNHTDHGLSIRSNFRDADFNALVKEVEDSYQSEKKEESLYHLLAHLLYANNAHIRQIQNISEIKSSTKTELVRRIYLSIDYIHASYAEHITLDRLATVAMLSKFHFLRVFKAIFGLSPHQYLKRVRLQKAIALIQKNNMPLYLVAQQVGIENGSSLSRMIYQLTGQRPSVLQANN
ncbi:MAG: AraC family transcriptional regulator [Reichenbachiella sp.]|uniref:helix-turn-helix domain-containing protein n=1 Tax=Reichenbachiella sp. TaxID=2184521 RepID=UPI003262CE16